jgi:vacuolar-type H+-ATPase subunit E/Vma4
LELKGITEMMIQEARESAELIIRNAQEVAESILEKQRQLGINQAILESSSLLKRAASEAEVERLRKLAIEKITANWIALSRKEQIISAVLDEAENRLQKMTRTVKYVSILKNLIVKAGILLGGGELDISLNEQDSELPLDLTKLAKEIGTSTKSETRLTLTREKISVIGGVIVRTMDGKTIMDCSFGDILKRNEKTIRTKISKILFE